MHMPQTPLGIQGSSGALALGEWVPLRHLRRLYSKRSLTVPGVVCSSHVWVCDNDGS